MKADDRAKAKQCPYCSGRRGRKVRNIETGEVFETQKDAALSGNTWPSSIYKCCKGLLNTAGGYHWEYVYEEMGE